MHLALPAGGAGSGRSGVPRHLYVKRVRRAPRNPPSLTQYRRSIKQNAKGFAGAFARCVELTQIIQLGCAHAGLQALGGGSRRRRVGACTFIECRAYSTVTCIDALPWY